MPEMPWLPWRSPRQAEGWETPYHHPLVEVILSEGGKSCSIPPTQLCEADMKTATWRPMPWASRGAVGRGWKHYKKLSSDCVFEGYDGYLFHTNNNVCEQILEGGGLSQDGLQKWLEVLERRLTWASDRRIEYRLLVIPERHAIYPDKIPGQPRPSPKRPIMRLKGQASPRLQKFVYPAEAMVSGRSSRETFYPHDVHFTRYGTYLCYRELAWSLGLPQSELIGECDLVRGERFILGDLAEAFRQPGRVVEWLTPPPCKIKILHRSRPFQTGQVEVFETENRNKPRLVLFRTSNGTQLFPFLFHHFSRIVAVAAVRVFFDLLESEQPDFVVSEIAERFLAQVGPRSKEDQEATLVHDDEVRSTFQEFTGVGLPLPNNQARGVSQRD
jgi:hypothetical protein